MRQIGKPHFPADLRDTLICLHNPSLGIHDSGNIHILNHRTVGICLKFPTEIIAADIKAFRQTFQSTGSATSF